MAKRAFDPHLLFDAAHLADSRAAGVYHVATRGSAKMPRSVLPLPHRQCLVEIFAFCMHKHAERCMKANVCWRYYVADGFES
jgi:hypothetical protein